MLIETFVFFDIEATGLPHFEQNQTKITELTFLAVSRRDIEVTYFENIPLVNKLSLVFNPQKEIQATASKLTGLSNKILLNQPIFKNRISCINSFLESLSKPVCLVAHNGNIFDYKILKAEYLDANENLPPDIYCVDSLWGFRKILKQTNLSYKNLKNNEDIVGTELLTDDEDEWPELNTTLEDWQELDELVESFSKSTLSPKSNNSLILDPNSPKTICLAKKSTTSRKNLLKNKDPNEKIVFKLGALYKRLLNKEAIEAHRSEADCIMLLQCVVAVKKEFLPWADGQCKLLDIIEPLKRR